MGAYTVSSIPLPPIAGVHGGTGDHTDTIWVVDPNSVPPPGNLRFSGLDVAVTTMLFQLDDPNVVPNWFGVAVPRGIQDFTRPHIFFHPTPGQANYVDSDYPTKSGKWPELFYYMELLGYQLDGARRNQIVIMPFLTEARKDTGILPANWQDIVTDILVAVRASIHPQDASPLNISQLVVSSFSAGMIYSDSFRRNGADMSAFLAEIWDFDGRFSTYNWITNALHRTAGVQVIKYDQVDASDQNSFHLPLRRWADYAGHPTSNMQVHALIRDFMFLHGASITGVGTLIDDSGATTGTATGHGTGTATGHSTGTTTVTATGHSTGTTTGTATGHSTGTTTGTATATSTGSITTSGTATHTGPSPARQPPPHFPRPPFPAPQGPPPHRPPSGPPPSAPQPPLAPGPMAAPPPMPHGPPPLPGWPTASGGHAPMPNGQGECHCGGAVTAIVGAAAASASASLTAIAAIAAQRAKRR
jgi:hypothetical protein